MSKQLGCLGLVTGQGEGKLKSNLLNFAKNCILLVWMDWINKYFSSCAQYSFHLDGLCDERHVAVTTAVLKAAASRVCLEQHRASLCDFYLAFSSITAWKNSRFILSLDFRMVVNLSIAVYALLMYVLISLLADKILPPNYMKWSTNFQGLILLIWPWIYSRCPFWCFLDFFGDYLKFCTLEFFSSLK